ncbi:MAG: TIM-barrel domain-containing protein [Chitinophagaceae bacterium]
MGWGYSFGLNGVADAAHIIPQYGNAARPFIISLDGWAGTQRYGTVWSGDQTGGAWEYIRFHIPTYLGSGLSGQPNITSDMDGIFGGKNPVINARDFQWKTFTPKKATIFVTASIYQKEPG